MVRHHLKVTIDVMKINDVNDRAWEGVHGTRQHKALWLTRPSRVIHISFHFLATSPCLPTPCTSLRYPQIAAMLTARRLLNSGLVIDQSIKRGFHFRNIDELSQMRIAVASAFPESALVVDGALPASVEQAWAGKNGSKHAASDEKEKDSIEYKENV